MQERAADDEVAGAEAVVQLADDGALSAVSRPVRSQWGGGQARTRLTMAIMKNICSDGIHEMVLVE